MIPVNFNRFLNQFYTFLGKGHHVTNNYVAMETKFQYVVEDIFEYLHAKFYANLSSRIALTMFAAK